MPRLRVHNLAMSLDGYVAGPGQSLTDPLGVGGERLHEWMFATRSGAGMGSADGDGQDSGDSQDSDAAGADGLDDSFIRAGDQGVGATIMGRNMFGPIRGPWGAERWTGWWGDNPPYHHPVFVLTHHPHPPITMKGGTTFNFVADGIDEALAQAFDAAAGDDVRIGGGASTVQQYLAAGLVDEMHVAIVPILLRGGERLFDNIDGGVDGYECVEFVSSPAVTHVRLARAK